MKCYVSVYSMHAAYQLVSGCGHIKNSACSAHKTYKHIQLRYCDPLHNPNSPLTVIVYDEGTMHMIHHYFVPRM